MPPLCIRCGLRPVVKAHGVTNPSARGLRIVQGQRWRWFCSTSCSALDRNDGFTRERMKKIARLNHQRCTARVLARIIAATKDVIDEQGKVDPKDMVRCVMRELGMAYQREYRIRERRSA